MVMHPLSAAPSAWSLAPDGLHDAEEDDDVDVMGGRFARPGGGAEGGAEGASAEEASAEEIESYLAAAMRERVRRGPVDVKGDSVDVKGDSVD
eukprot:980271-Prorocentrum_minimum.AAC.1